LTTPAKSGEASSVAPRTVAGDTGPTYLDRARAHRVFDVLKAKTIEALMIQDDDRVADIGCGTGEEVAAMAGAARNVAAVGFDLSEPNITEARRRHQGSPATFILANAHALPINTAGLAGCRIERTLQHVAQPQAVMAETARVVQPGGRIAAAEPDWALCVCAGGSERVSTAVLHNWLKGRNNNPTVGRNLPGLMVNAGIGCVDLWSESVVYRTLNETENAYPVRRAVTQAIHDGVIKPSRGEQWIHQLEEASQHGYFTFAVPMFVAIGIRAD
jgi:ubiquinone/menaquinone biosynthesis C-methylase UbiE